MMRYYTATARGLGTRIASLVSTTVEVNDENRRTTLGSIQNPIHRDRDTRGEGAQAFKDNKEASDPKGAEVGRSAPFSEDQAGRLTDEQRNELATQHASERLVEVQREVDDEAKTK